MKLKQNKTKLFSYRKQHIHTHLPLRSRYRPLMPNIHHTHSCKWINIIVHSVNAVESKKPPNNELKRLHYFNSFRFWFIGDWSKPKKNKNKQTTAARPVKASVPVVVKKNLRTSLWSNLLRRVDFVGLTVFGMCIQFDLRKKWYMTGRLIIFYECEYVSVLAIER